MYCPWCGADNPEDSVFCQQCGQRMGPAGATAATPPAGPSAPATAAAPGPAPEAYGAPFPPPPPAGPSAPATPPAVAPGPAPEAYGAPFPPPPAGMPGLMQAPPMAVRMPPARARRPGIGTVWLLRLFAWLYVLLSVGAAVWIWIEYRAVTLLSRAVLINTAYFILGTVILLQGLFGFLLSLVVARMAENVIAIRQNTGPGA